MFWTSIFKVAAVSFFFFQLIESSWKSAVFLSVKGYLFPRLEIQINYSSCNFNTGWLQYGQRPVFQIGTILARCLSLLRSGVVL
ncbi:hypothetical protein E2320_001082 [Naja naja]|nr:hypothetical protein E2320_001082 [Naja naja]